MAQTWSLEQKEQILAKTPLPMKLGPVYKEWHDQVSQMEAAVLRQLGFTLYWIPDSHPHKFILYFCRVLELTNDKVSFCFCKQANQASIGSFMNLVYSSGDLHVFVSLFRSQ
jgi:hypothetical protein